MIPLLVPYIFLLSRARVGGALVRKPKNKFLPILMKIGNAGGIAFIKMYLNFCVKILSRTLLFHDLPENEGS